MQLPPLVSIIIPVFDDEATIESSLRSATTQTLEQIEILVVDDGSTDSTPQLVEKFMASDSRIRLIRQPRNMSAFQARRRGINESVAPYLMFLDGDDELEPNAAALAASTAESKAADVVQFGVTLIWANSAVGPNSGFAKRLQPRNRSLEGDAITLGLFPAGEPAGGQLWKYLFRVEILRRAYEMLPADLEIYRANDLPIAFLSSIIARKYVSIPDKLYRYYFQRGGSGNRVNSIDQVEFQMLALESFRAISGAVNDLTYHHSDPRALLECYASARYSLIGTVLRYLARIEDEVLRRLAIARLEARTSRIDVVRSAALFQPQFLDVLPHYCEADSLQSKDVKSILLTTSQLTTGGVSGVLLAQARLLLKAGYRVTIAAQRSGSDQSLVPEGAHFYEVAGSGMAARLDFWAELCQAEEIDVIIEHRVLYSRQWNAFALMGRACGASTIGWVHNFAGRPLYDLNDLHGFMRYNSPVLAMLIVLSPLDVAFWKLRGVENSYYLPNPPSPLLLENGVVDQPRTGPSEKVHLVWVGRLDQHTKQVLSLLDVAVQLKNLNFEFRLTVVGPDWQNMTVDRFNKQVDRRGLGDSVKAIGPLVGSDLVELLDSADGFVGTSVIEGYQLTLVEAQSRGLPVFMYEMPWLVPVEANKGIVSAPQGDAVSLARRIVESFSDARLYAELSEGALAGAAEAFRYDFGTLYQQLIQGELPAMFSPSLDLESAAEVLDWSVFFVERNSGIRKRLEASSKSVDKLKSQLKKSESQIARLEDDAARLRRANKRQRTQTMEGSSILPAGGPASGAGVEPERSTMSRLVGSPPGVKSDSSSVPATRQLAHAVKRMFGVGARAKSGSAAASGASIVSVARAELMDSTLMLKIEHDSRGAPDGIEAVREVSGVEEVHSFELSDLTAGTTSASLPFAALGSRRWTIRAHYPVPDTSSGEHVVLPFQQSALRRSGSDYRLRCFNGVSLQIVPKS